MGSDTVRAQALLCLQTRSRAGGRCSPGRMWTSPRGSHIMGSLYRAGLHDVDSHCWSCPGFFNSVADPGTTGTCKSLRTHYLDVQQCLPRRGVGCAPARCQVWKPQGQGVSAPGDLEAGGNAGCPSGQRELRSAVRAVQRVEGQRNEGQLTTSVRSRQLSGGCDN